jgi:polyhydroxyalkanoate synthesis regulator phasin
MRKGLTMSNITDPLKDIFLAGVGALAIGGEKASTLVGQLVEKGQLTVEQGKEIMNKMAAKAEGQKDEIRDDIIAAQMRTMSKEDREALAARVAELAAQIDSEQQEQAEAEAEVEAVETVNEEVEEPTEPVNPVEPSEQV